MWLFVPGLHSPSAPATEDSTSPSILLAPEFALWVLSNGKPTRLPSSQVEWSKVPWIHVLSSTIWNPSTANRIAAEWISALQDFRVRAPASQGSGSAPTTSDGSGRKSSASSTRQKRGGSSSRTSPASFRLTVGERSRRSSGTWARAGSLRNGTVSPREPWAPRTSDIDSSCSLPTPTAQDSRASGVAANWTELSGRHAGATLTDVAVRGLSTPSRTSGESSTPGDPTGSGETHPSGRFVAWMMGLPTGWTEV